MLLCGVLSACQSAPRCLHRSLPSPGFQVTLSDVNAHSNFLCRRSTKNIPEFKVAPEMALELLMASNFLDT